MPILQITKRIYNIIIILIIFIGSGLPTLAQNPGIAIKQKEQPDTPVVVQIYYNSTENLNQFATYIDIWEVNHEARYLVAMLSPEQYISLQQQGYRIVIDQAKTDLIHQEKIPLPGQGLDSIPGYPCYRTVEETYSSMQTMQTNYPDLVDVYDYGDSWDKQTSGDPTGYDLYAMHLTNKSIPGPKPTFFLMAEIHAREYVTAETAMRYAEYLATNYGINPDITWLLDYYQVYIVPMTNPDGRKKAETGILWRKNTHTGCADPNSRGVDLNRNHSFKWGRAGTSPCDELYQGATPASEPETQVIQSYVSTLFPDQRGPGDTDPAPVDTTGTFITLHSYSRLVLWPWGWTLGQAPNSTQLQTLGCHLAYFNNYTPEQSVNLYPTTGTSDDWAYGQLGIASYTFEMGTDFFQDCGSFESTIYPDNLDALLYAFKTTRRPYMNPAGPDSLSVVTSPAAVTTGEQVLLTAVANDTRFNGSEPTQNIAEARYSIDDPSWITGTITYPMTASDGSFNNKIENIEATIDTKGLSVGRHTIFVESKDTLNNWGVASAVFLTITQPLAPTAKFSSNSPVELGQEVQFINLTTGTLPISYTWDFGDGSDTSTETNPTYFFLDIGTYTVTLVASNTIGTASISHPVEIIPVGITSVDLTQVTSNPILPGAVIDISANLSPDNVSMPYDYTINFGDGLVITGTSSLDPLVFPPHVFTSSGTYTIQIWVQNAGMINPITDSLDIFVGVKSFLPLVCK